MSLEMTRRSSQSDVPLRDWYHHEPKDLKQVEVHVQDQPAPTDGQVYWQPGAKSQFPWFGFGAMFTMLCCGAFTVIILMTSESKYAEEWPAYQGYEWIRDSWKERAQLSPSTALAIVNTLYNVALAVAIGNGVVIAWWRKALHGATVQDLHQSWAFSTSIYDLITAGKNFNLIALCALTAKLALVDNVLLQQATYTQPGWSSQNVTDFRFPIARELPSDFLGAWSDDGKIGALSDIFSKDLYDHFTGTDIKLLNGLQEGSSVGELFYTRCVGYCTFRVEGFGVNMDCLDNVVSTYEVNPQAVTLSGDSTSLNQTDTGSQGAASSLMRTLFEFRRAGSEGVEYPDPWIEMIVEYATITVNETNTNLDGSFTPPTSQNCQGQLNRKICTMRPVTATYLITQVNDTRNDGLTGYRYEIPASPAYQTNSSAYNDVMNSLYQFLSNSFQTTIDLTYLNGTGFTAQSSSGGYIGQFWALGRSAHYFPSSCSILVLDPTDWIRGQLDSILLRASISATIVRPSPWDRTGFVMSENIRENITAYRTTETIQYVSDYRWLGAALSVMAICIMCVLPTYWGYWELGRKVTFGPMEIASAFQAPALSSSVTTAGGQVEVVLKEVGQREVRYGIIESGGLAMAEARETVRLAPGQPIKSSGDL